MSILLQRLDREAARAMIARARESSIEAVAASMPDRDATVTYSPVGGARITTEALESLRRDVVGLAREHGYPVPSAKMQSFEGHVSRLLRRALPMTPNEASYEEVWSYVTCCWLLDVAVWRFGHDADERRFIGHVNRNTFRRLWWRAEVLGDVPLERLGEDELVNIMERPTIAGDRRVAQAIAAEFLQRLDTGVVADRMLLMREAMKRILRLTPFVSFSSLNEPEIRAVMIASFDAAAAGLAGLPVPPLASTPARMPPPSPLVAQVDVNVAAAINGRAGTKHTSADVGESVRLAREVALDIARKTGRVTNMTLREVLPISAEEARVVFQDLIAAGSLQRRGIRRGTHYVLPPPSDLAEPPALEPSVERSTAQPRRRETALRRLLRRER